MKVVRCDLATKRPADWEVYDLAADPRETTNLAASRPDVIAAAQAVLRRETAANAEFPVPLPDVSPP
jgi:hypothetical protein